MNKLQTGCEILGLWGKFVASRVQYEIKYQRVSFLVRQTDERLSKLHPILTNTQRTVIDHSDNASQGFADNDFTTTQGLRDFVLGFEQPQTTKSASVLARRQELIAERLLQTRAIFSNIKTILKEATTDYLKSLV